MRNMIGGHEVPDCQTPGRCDSKTRYGKCVGSLNDTNFKARMCPFKKIHGMMPHKYALKMLDEGASLKKIMDVTGYTDEQLEDVIRESRR